jgi:O-antigen/teichoic acid export membrane protein
MAISLVEFAAANLDTAVIGRVLGEAALGLYNRALLLATLPVEKLAGIVSRVALPVLSAVQDDRRKVGSTFLLALAGIGVASGAVSLGLAAAADEVVRVLLGPAWGAAVPVLRVLAWAAPLMVMSHVCGVVCDATAQLRFKLAVQSGALVMLALLIMLWLDHGVLGVAFALVVTELLRLGAYLAGLGRALHCRGRDLARVLAAVAAGAALVQLAVAAVARLGRGQLAAPALLAAEMLAGACALALTLVIALRLLAPTAAGSIARQHLPGVERLMLWAGGPQR